MIELLSFQGSLFVICSHSEDIQAPRSSFLIQVHVFVPRCRLAFHVGHTFQLLNISTIVFKRNFNNVPTITSLLLRRSKCTNSKKKVYPHYRESLKKKKKKKYHVMKFMKYVKPKEEVLDMRKKSTSLQALNPRPAALLVQPFGTTSLIQVLED